MKRQKYGYIYRTHLFGNPTVRVTGADNVRHILMGENKLVSVQWPASVRTILGSDTLSNVHGAMHKSKKKVSVDIRDEMWLNLKKGGQSASCWDIIIHFFSL